MSSSSFASGLTAGDGDDDDDAGVEDTEVRNRLYKRIDCARVHMCFGIKAHVLWPWKIQFENSRQAFMTVK